MHRYARISVLSAAIVSASMAPAMADGVSALMADGQPWNATAPNGRTLQMTLNPDGTGQMKMGIMRRNISWRGIDDGVCLDGMPTGGERCVTLTARGNGFVGRGPDGGEMAFSR